MILGVVILKKHRNKYQSRICCEYRLTKFGYIAGCNNYRVAYNKFMHYCPYCGKHILNFGLRTHNHMKGEPDDEYIY